MEENDYDHWNLQHVLERYEKHLREAHAGDAHIFHDCASCGALESRVARLKRAEAESVTAPKH